MLKSKNFKWIVIVILVHLVIGLIYSGSLFLKNMNDSIPSMPVGNSQLYMAPGDHFEQFYRYSIAKNNVLRGNAPYYSGYEYNFGDEFKSFSEGLIFFPFSMLSGLLAIFTSDILAYNLMALLSYIFVGISVYLLIKTITKNIGAAIISSIYFSALPFRTSFLYGEMVFGIDLCLLPLPILFTEKALESKKRIYFILVVASLFLISTANFQLFYYYALFTFPYFAIRLWMYFKDLSVKKSEKKINIGIILIGIAAIGAYLYHILTIMSKSGLNHGQDFNELFANAPGLKNIITIFNGNEKNIYLGWPGIIFLLFMFTGCLWKYKTYLKERESLLLFIFIPTFLISYVFTFGPNIDKFTGINLYRWFFDHIPGANGTRTTGRIMSVAGFYFTIVLGIIIQWSYNFMRIREFRYNIVKYVLVVVISIGIIYNFNYLSPTMVKLEKQNNAYEAIRGTESRVLGIPFQSEPDNYMNATFMYYALNYNLKMFNGHSSLYTSSYFEFSPKYTSINDGELSKDTWELLKRQGFKYITVHNTEYEPRVSRIVLAKLINSIYLKTIKNDKGVYLLEILDKPKESSNEISFDSIFKEYLNIGYEKRDIGNIQYLNGWYNREAYPEQTPFRWTKKGISSLVYIVDKDKPISVMEFDIKAPLPNSKIILRLNGKEYINMQSSVNSEWNHIILNVKDLNSAYYYVEIETNNIYNPGGHETRELGLMVSDIQTK